MRPHERRQEQTRNDLIAQAIAMIVERGIGGLSIRTLADALDYTPGALYTYFSGKDDLIDAARQRCFAELNASVMERAAPHTTAAEMLLEAGMGYVDFASTHPNKYYLMFGMEPSPATSGEQRSVAMAAPLEILKRGLATGEFALPVGYDLETAAVHCWATVHGIASLLPTVLANEREKTTARARLILQRVVRSFSAVKP